jgi:Arc/MetJ-type ribon-helix-helix transcriptional regulator
MTINLPDDLERFIQAEVRNGNYPTEEAALAEAVRLPQGHLRQTAKPALTRETAPGTPAPVLGAMRDAADEIDEIVADAMKIREQQAWRLSYQ